MTHQFRDLPPALTLEVIPAIVGALLMDAQDFLLHRRVDVVTQGRELPRPPQEMNVLLDSLVADHIQHRVHRLHGQGHQARSCQHVRAHSMIKGTVTINRKLAVGNLASN